MHRVYLHSVLVCQFILFHGHESLEVFVEILDQCLDYLIPFYKNKFASLGQQLKVVKVWSDNAPTEYRCRQNFVQISTVQDRDPDIELMHRLAMVDYFKGAHNAYGKVPKHHRTEQELNGNRSLKGEGVFRTCFWNLAITETTGARNNNHVSRQKRDIVSLLFVDFSQSLKG